MNAFLKNGTRVQSWIKGRLGLVVILLVFTGAASGQPPRGGPVTANFRDVDFTDLVQAVSVATGKNFVLDPCIHARVTMISSTEMSSAAFYDAFLSIVHVHGWVTKAYGDLVTIRRDPKSDSGCSPITPVSHNDKDVHWAQLTRVITIKVNPLSDGVR
jgi:general secretion pathway protein D